MEDGIKGISLTEKEMAMESIIIPVGAHTKGNGEMKKEKELGLWGISKEIPTMETGKRIPATASESITGLTVACTKGITNKACPTERDTIAIKTVICMRATF